MYISLIDIIHFGGISGWKVALKPGLEVICGPNESGKTTIYHFIRMMFYSRTERGKELSNHPRRRYQPWDGSAMEGAIEFFLREKEYRLYKRFGQTPGQDEVQLICLTTASEVALPKEQDAGEYLFGISLADYDRLVCASVDGMFRTSGKEDSYAEHLLESGSSRETDHSASLALGRLEHAMEALVSKRGDRGRLVEQRALCQKLFREKNEAVEYMEQKQELLDELQETDSHYGEEKKLRLAGWGIMTALIAAVILGIFQKSYFFAVALLLAVAYVALFSYRKRSKMNQQEKQAAKEQKLEQFLSAYGKKNPDTAAREYRLAKEKQLEMEAYYKSLSIARELMSSAVEEANASFLPELNKETGEIMSRFTNGKYQELIIDETFQVQVKTGGRYRDASGLSYGTRQQIYLALRLAVARRLKKQGESYPLILDELFSGYDDSRLEDTMDFLREYAQGSKEQVILFTAQKTVAELAADVEHPVIRLAPVNR